MNTIPHVGPLKSYPFYDWSRLQGATVEVRQNGVVARYGFVDAATADGTTVWLAQEGLLGRVLIDKASGYEIRVAPAELQRINSLTQAACVKD